MALNPEAVGSISEPAERSWTSKDALLYALGVGAGGLDPTGFELDFTTENSEGIAQRVLPTFTTIVGQGGGARASIGDFDPAMLVHGEQEFGCTVRSRPTAPSRSPRRWRACTTRDRLASSCSKASRGTRSRASSRSPPAPRCSSVGQGGFGGPRNPEGDEESALAAEPLPTREPDEVVTYATRPDQALLYRLSGDRNPLHSDPTFAKRAGFDRPILHGLCTYGFTGRALLHAVCASDPARFGAMRARFSKPTMPGDTLTISVWDLGDQSKGSYRFRTETQRGETVIDAGLFQLA